MTDSPFSCLQLLASLSKENFERLTGRMEKLRLRKGEILIREGERNERLYFVTEGILRAFLPEDGSEMTYWFAPEQDFFFSSWGYVGGGASPIVVEAASDVRLAAIRKSELDALCADSPELANWCRKLMERRMLEIDDWWRHYSLPRAEERYEMLLRKAPQILQRIPLKHIATYLWVTPQSLSRIRARYKRKKRE